MLISQPATARLAAASTLNAIAHPYAFQLLPPNASVRTLQPAATMPPRIRRRAKVRRWRYSQGAMMRRMPARGGHAHHARKLFAAKL
jgi:hypothetical protein